MIRPFTSHLAVRTVCLLAVAISAASLRPLAAQEVSAYDAATFYETTTIFGASFSPDEKEILFTSDASGVFNAWKLAVEGGEPVRLTESTTDASMAIGFFPRDYRILFTADQGGNELNHVYVREMDGAVVDLTPGEEVKASFAGWLEDDSGFFVVTNERDARYFDLYRYRVGRAGDAAYPRRRVYQNDGGFDVSGISRDGRWIALTKIRNGSDSDVYVLDASREGAEPLHVTPHEGNVSHGFTTFTPDGRELYYSSNEGSEFDRIWAYDLTTGVRRVVEEDDWDVLYVGFSRDGRYQVVGVNADARTEVTIRDLEEGEPVVVRDLPSGDVRGVRFSRSGRRMAFYLNGDTAPSNLFVLDLETGAHRRLTDTLNPAIDAGHLVDSRVVRYPSFDGLEIPALLYKPHQASAGRPVPALVNVHGGPGGQSRTGYNPMVQHLVNQGYAVLSVNNRGSSGYGKTFFHMDDRKHGDVDLKDCVWARRYLDGLDWVDGERVGIMGGSYGGYMVCAALAFEPQAFDIGIDIFGVTNWLRTLTSIPPWWEDFREALYDEMGDPIEDEERLRARSPLLNAGKIERPLLVVQGANDPRVLQAESDEMVEAVRANGVPVEYVLFEDEGHGFRKKVNRITASEAFVEFADRYLKGAEGP